MSKRSTLLRRVRAKEKVKSVSSSKNLPLGVSGRALHRNRMRRKTAKEAGRAIEKSKEKGKGKDRSGGKAKGNGKGLTCYVCGGIGHPVRLCPVKDGLNDLEQDAPEGEDTNEDGCWTEEDDETLQLSTAMLQATCVL